MSHPGRPRAPAAAAADPPRPWPLGPLARHLEQALAAERALAGHYDAKTLHVWRVQLRRLIAAADGLARLSPRDLPNGLVDQLKALRQRTGGSRDIDVLLDTTLPAFVLRKPGRAPEPALLAELESRREAARHQALAAIANAGLAPLQAQLDSWLAERVETVALPPPTLAGALLDLRLGKLHKRQRKFRDSPRRLHRLRTAVKNMNYALSLAEGLFDPAAAEAWSKALADLQSQLGKAHDLLAGSQYLADLERAADQARFAKAFGHWCERQSAKLADKAAGTLARLDELERCWR